jgi:phospholipase/carboxylesterase
MTMLIHDVIPASGGPWHLMLHGLGDTRNGWKEVAPLIAPPGAGWIFVQAPDSHGPGWSWFNIDWSTANPDVAGVARSRGQLIALLEHLEKTQGIRTEDLRLVGFSQGCLMAMELALTYDRLFAGVAGISGWIGGLDRFPAGLSPVARQQRILMTHGRWDDVLPIAATRPQVAKLKTMGLHLDWREYDKDHGLDPEHEVEDLRTFLTAPERWTAS